jgi:hypothetical protein
LTAALKPLYLRPFGWFVCSHVLCLVDLLGNAAAEMKKTPSYLKGLAEDRARAAGDVERYVKIAKDVSDALEAARATLAACDLLIRRIDARLNPEDIPLIRVNRCYGGARGKLRATVADILKTAAPRPVTTIEIGVEIQVRFGLVFETSEARSDWQNNSIGRLLRDLLDNGLVERLHDPKCNAQAGGRWRWKTDSTQSSDQLRGQIEGNGGSVVQYDGGEE